MQAFSEMDRKCKSIFEIPSINLMYIQLNHDQVSINHQFISTRTEHLSTIVYSYIDIIIYVNKRVF